MRFGWAGLGVALLELGGCSSDEALTAFEDEQGYCDGLCEGARRCRFASNDCEASCLREVEPTGIRIGALSEVGRCLAREECSLLASEDFWKPCFEHAEQVLPLTQSLVDYCVSATRREFECNAWWDVEECTVQMKLWADEKLDDARQCQRKECDQLQDCEKAVFNP